jgi:type VI protein secretion system component VasK
VLLDTAGRYSVYAEDHFEWLGFLNILKKPLKSTNQWLDRDCQYC